MYHVYQPRLSIFIVNRLININFYCLANFSRVNKNKNAPHVLMYREFWAVYKSLIAGELFTPHLDQRSIFKQTNPPSTLFVICL